ncbi:Uncharacterised protein [Dermatophilus congolensis]|uniref:Uncharacterized protein n=1 Tax=Dermatophilus congolensis TaxID=1863 RepID=A0A239VC77_9MICO|nr:Uncharacterised protein [Dermatophilus congolensis]
MRSVLPARPCSLDVYLGFVCGGFSHAMGCEWGRVAAQRHLAGIEMVQLAAEQGEHVWSTLHG